MTGLAPSLRLAWRRSRVFWILWVLGLASLLPATASKYEEIIPNGVEAGPFLAQLAADPTMRALLGPAYDLTTMGGFTFWRVGAFTATAAGMMAGLGVIRATRAEEEEGRVELLRSGPVARHAPLAAGILLSLLGCLATGALVAGFMGALGTPWTGALASGAAIALTGAMFVGLGATFAQVFETARAARSWTIGAALGGLYLARAMVDGSRDSDTMQLLRWGNALEWSALVRPYADERFWVLLLPLAVTVVGCALAFALEARRDHGAGLVHARPGRAEAASWLSAPLGLSWRLLRGTVIGWTIGILVAALGLGSMSGTIDQMVQGNDQIAEMFRKMGGGATQLKDAFYQAMLGIMVTLIALCGVLLLQGLRQEETRGHAELLLSTPVSRTRLASSYLLWALGLPAVLLVATGALLPLVDVAQNGGTRIGDLTEAALCFLPGLLVVVAFAMFLLGWAPRLFALAWVLLGWTMFLSWLAPLFDLPDWVLKLHPWGHLPHLPTDELTWTAILIETALGLLLLALGLVGYRSRNIPA